MKIGEVKDRIIRLIEQEAARKASILSGEYIRCKPYRREAVQAGIEVEKWLTQSCRKCLEDDGRPEKM